MRVGLALSIFALAACSGQHYVTVNKKALLSDRDDAKIQPVARELRWVFHRRIDGRETYYGDAETAKLMERKERASVVFPKANVATGELLYAKKLEKDRERSMKEQEAFTAAASRTEMPINALHLLSRDLLQVVNMPPAVQRTVASYIGASAPEGSVLWVFAAEDARNSNAFTGRERTYAAFVTLELSKDRVIGSSGRQLVDRHYTGNYPNIAPDGMALDEEELDEDEAETRDLALVLASTVRELSLAL